MENERDKEISDGYLVYDWVEGQYYRCRACRTKTSARAVEERIHYHRCDGRGDVGRNGTGGSADI